MSTVVFQYRTDRPVYLELDDLYADVKVTVGLDSQIKVTVTGQDSFFKSLKIQRNQNDAEDSLLISGSSADFFTTSNPSRGLPIIKVEVPIRSYLSCSNVQQLIADSLGGQTFLNLSGTNYARVSFDTLQLHVYSREEARFEYFGDAKNVRIEAEGSSEAILHGTIGSFFGLPTENAKILVMGTIRTYLI